MGSMSYYGLLAPEDGFRRAEAAAQRALALDPDLAEAHGALALGSLFFRWDWAASEREFKKSIALNPAIASVRAFYSILLSTSGRHEEATAEARAARQIDPLSPLVNMSVGWSLFSAGRLSEAVTELRHTRALLRGEERYEATSIILVCLELLGRYEEAAQESVVCPCFGVPIEGAALMQAFKSGGPQAYWAERLRQIERLAPKLPSLMHFSYGAILTQLGRYDEAVDHLATLVDLRHGAPVFYAMSPSLRALHGHPGFEQLLTRIGVPRSPTALAPHTTPT
jgi:tetratricopeptide (TPR) repeat protein